MAGTRRKVIIANFSKEYQTGTMYSSCRRTASEMDGNINIPNIN